MQAKIILYILIANKETMSYDIISEHPDRYEECSVDIVSESDLDFQVVSLYSKYLDLDSSYIRFINLRPFIESKILKIPYYCLIPYNSYEFKNSYKIPVQKYVQSVPNLRQILNII
jgi:hypothetical protein